MMIKLNPLKSCLFVLALSLFFLSGCGKSAPLNSEETRPGGSIDKDAMEKASTLLCPLGEVLVEDTDALKSSFRGLIQPNNVAVSFAKGDQACIITRRLDIGGNGQPWLSFIPPRNCLNNKRVWRANPPTNSGMGLAYSFNSLEFDSIELVFKGSGDFPVEVMARELGIQVYSCGPN